MFSVKKSISKIISVILVVSIVVLISVAVYLFLFNTSGQLSVTTTIRSNIISAGGYHTCALKSNGTVWCWGNNYYGQLGDGTYVDKNIPVQVLNLTNVIQISAGEDHTCALKSDGTVWCWGRNDEGQLGDGTNVSKNIPVQVRNFNYFR